MLRLIKNTAMICLAGAFLGCGKKAQIPYYSVSKVFKTDSLTTLNVHINNRMTAPQLLLIAGKVKGDSAKINNLEIHYLLPGNTETSSGDNSYYASTRYLNNGEIRATDTKDDNGNAVRLRIFGLSEVEVKHLLALQPAELVGKNVLGKFIDDYNHTIIVPFKNPQDDKNNLYIIELDNTGKVVSATMPEKLNDGGSEKWMVTQHGDYITIKDSVLGQFAADGLGLPFNSIKSGI